MLASTRTINNAPGCVEFYTARSVFVFVSSTAGAAHVRPASSRQPQRFRVDDEHRPLRRRGGFHIRPIVRAFAGKPQARQAGLLQGTPILQYPQPGQQRFDANQNQNDTADALSGGTVFGTEHRACLDADSGQ